MTIRIIATVIIISLSSALMGQIRYFDERYISTMSQLNPVLVNPGAIGWEDSHQLIANYRNKWATFPGSPKSFLVSYDGPLAQNLSFGAQVLSDSNGSLNLTKVQGGFSYQLNTSVNKLSVGLSGEYARHNLDSDVMNHELVDDADIRVLERLEGTGFFDVSVGIYGVYDNTITYGLVLPALVNSRLDDAITGAESREFGYMASLGYIHRAEGVDAVFEPSIIVKQVNNVPFHADINLLGRFVDNKFRGGFTYTVGADNRVGFLVGTAFNALEINYGYNLSRNEFQDFNNGSHELGLRFDIGGDRQRLEVEGKELMEGVIQSRDGLER